MFFYSNQVKIYYEVVGSGSPLLLLHGNDEDHTIFDRAVEVLSEHFTCYLIDSRGHGRSDSVAVLSYEDMAEDMAGLIRELGLHDVTFYGFSDGGIVGLLLAALHPELVRTLIVSGANITPRGVKPLLFHYYQLVYLFSRDPKLALMLKQAFIPPSLLGKITARTLVLAGSRDVIRGDETRRIAASIPHAQLRFLAGEGHGSYVVHSDKIAHIILSYIRHVRRDVL